MKEEILEIRGGNNNRINWVDIAKFVCIMFVMLSHLESATNVLRVFYKPFFLFLFFFCSGYVYKHKDNFKGFLYKKFRSLFIPWLVFSILIVLSAQIISFNEHDSLLESLMWNFLQIRGKSDEVWFVAALFAAFIPFYFIIKKYNNSNNKNKDRNIIIFTLILSILSYCYSKLVNPNLFIWGSNALPWHLDYIFQAIFFMTLGYLFKYKWETKFNKYNNVKNRILITLIYLLLIYSIYIFNINLSLFLDVIYHYLTSIIGCIVIISYCKVIKINKYISFVGQNTLIYFAFHGKLYSLIQTILKKIIPDIYLIILNNVFYSTVFSICFAILLSILLIIPTLIINNYFPFIMGKKNVNFEMRKEK